MNASLNLDWNAGWRIASAWRAAAAVAGVLVWTGGCGASYQSIYEGEVRFEHCYRLDEEARIPLTQRRECWREWTKFYTYGQTRDRLEYALKRQRELSAQIGNPGGSPTVTEDSARLVAPAPTSPFEPPPHVHSAATSDAGADADANLDPMSPPSVEALLAAGAAPPGQRCMLGCLKTWHGCVETCEERDTKCRPACDVGFRECVSRCIEP